jgi:hypothetical protein
MRYNRVILWQNIREGKSRSARVYKRKLIGVTVQIQVKYLRYQLENKVEEKDSPYNVWLRGLCAGASWFRRN